MSKILPIHENIKNKLDSFHASKKIPHIIFHGKSGTGKRTIVFEFLHKIYNYDKANMKSNIMFVNCAHGKGIKFIREDLKLFAKTNIQFNRGIIFKSIVLLNADFLTIDAQSALRRCIEQFSLNTRFFIIVENKNKLLNPILSRFCEIYFPDTVNLHKYQLKSKYELENLEKTRYQNLCKIMDKMPTDEYIIIVSTVNELYSAGYSAIDLNEWIQKSDNLDDGKKAAIELCFEKVKTEYRCEKLLMIYILNQMHKILHDCKYSENNIELMNNIGFI
uniref:Replication factor C small subunit n=1 Tax=viral metagenome TaxID=1070528 RepID=A0A6C0HZT0_9ZZZZ